MRQIFFLKSYVVLIKRKPIDGLIEFAQIRSTCKQNEESG